MENVVVSANDCMRKYGAPELEKAMVLWDVPANISLGELPNRLYCNRDMVAPLTKVFGLVIARGLVGEVKTFDGCFNIRKKRGGSSASLHSWGIAIDINAAWNRMGVAPTMSKALVNCFTEGGFEWGGNWVKPDGMHFQLSKI